MTLGQNTHYVYEPQLVSIPIIVNAGRYCETNTNDCLPAPCTNGGQCVDEVDGYHCACQPEYVGVTCSHHICDEDTSPCLNGGTCHVEDSEPRCRCTDAFSGVVCETDKCLNVTCENSGTCENGICICQPGEIYVHLCTLFAFCHYN